AFPYLMLSLFPALMRFVPRPGVWMEAFKQFMGFLMMATVVWLAWVFGLQVGVNGLIALMGGFVVMGIGAWVLGRWGNLMMASRTRLIAHVVAGVLIAGGIGLVWTNSRDLAPSASASTQSTTTAEGITWEAFTPERFAEVRATGKPVFIDFTAAWCLSCQVNEKVALSKPEIAAEFKKRGIVTMKADWTSRNEAITRKLAEFGRNGVPLYVLYTKDQNQPPMVLPEVITPSIVMDALQKVN
ncbi:MAG TPA: thioredoxin family protein, partial [Acidobacteriota bacterium]|nr:thioredoxin family protein [Acidobacteriota bacterium]